MVPQVIVHIPHASRDIPGEIRNQFVVNSSALEKEIDRLTDHFTDELFVIEDPRVKLIRFPISRFAVDPERFVDDSHEPMAERGQGVIYMRTTQLNTLRRKLTPQERQDLIDQWYTPHHKLLDQSIKDALKKYDRAILIDGHSFPATPLPVDLDQSTDRPEICLGVDPWHTPAELVNLVKTIFEDFGCSVDINRPYAGTMVPMFGYKKDRRINSIMIEINRYLYLENDPENVCKNNNFQYIQKILSQVLIEILEWHEKL